MGGVTSPRQAMVSWSLVEEEKEGLVQGAWLAVVAG